MIAALNGKTVAAVDFRLGSWRARKLPQQEGMRICHFPVLLRASGTDAMAGVVVDAQQNGFSGRSGGLQSRGHLRCVKGRNARVSDAGGEQHGGVRGSVFHRVRSQDFGNTLAEVFLARSRS
jgi:hypothetical protein